MAIVIGVDPGATESAVVFLDGGEIHGLTISDNPAVLRILQTASQKHSNALLAIECIQHYGTGMPVGADVFRTCFWIGRFIQVWPGQHILVPRPTVKTHLCQTPRAKDANVRQALIDRLGCVGTKKQPGPLYGVNSHLWAALAVAVTVYDGPGVGFSLD